MRKLILIGFFLSMLVSHAQGEANIWYFGQNAGLDFNSSVPVALTNGQLVTDEGCATISNSSGQLLFYTDGITVYNKNHGVMINGNGLMGHSSSSQSATIVPMPGSNHLFYVFTIDAEARPNGFRYSIVDMNLDGGNGAVTADKNILIYTPTCEKIAINKHSNNVDYWIVTHGFNNNHFYAYLLTNIGLNTNPIISSVGFTPSIPTQSPFNRDSTKGCMKIAPDGSKLAIAHSDDSWNSNGVLQLLDFNNSTGSITNPVTLIQGSNNFSYGVEFSPNSQVLYWTDSNKLTQFDLTVPNIVNSAVQFIFPNYSMGALQLGPDNKIYFAQFNRNYIGVINNPNIIGNGCDPMSTTISIGTKVCRFGLPSFNQSFFFTPLITVNSNCVGEPSVFNFSTSQTILSATWNFGDGNTSTSLSPTHTYTTAGTYNVTVTTTSPSGSGSATREIVISEVPTATQPTNSLICDDNNDGFFTSDLTTKTAAILNGQSATQFGVRYFANATDYANNIVIANPNSFQNATAYQLQTIIAEVYNLDNPNCKTTTTFDIQVFESPLPSSTISPIQLCDNTSFGTEVDGKVVFNLTSKQTAILNGQSATNYTISYYKDAALTNLISNPAAYVNTNVVETIYVKMTNNQNVNCFATTSFQIEVFQLPTINTPIPLKQCDDNNDGFSVFNLTEANELVVASTSGLTFSYFETSAEAQSNTNPILNFSAYTNQSVSTDQIFIRVENTNGCFRIATLNLVVSTTLIPTTFQIIKNECDDLASGSITDGITTFDFSDVTTQIQALYPTGQLLDITYYKNLADALAEQNAISDISNYTNIGYPNTQNIYVRVDSQLNNECIGLGHHITLHVERIPIIQPRIYTQCDDNQDGQFAFNTTNLQFDVLNGLSNVTLSYWDANNNPLSNPLPNPFNTTSQVIRVRATNNTTSACYFESTITFKVDDLPEAFLIPTSLTAVCDDEANPINQNGLYSFDTSSFQSIILGTQIGMIVNYYDSNNNTLSSPLPNPFISSTQNIRVEVINPLNTICKAYTTIPLVVYPVPEIKLYGEDLICSNNPLFTKEIKAGLIDESTILNYTYQWYLNNNAISGATNYTLIVNTEGTYTVLVTNSNGCVRTRTITVTASNSATIENIQIVDLSDENSVTVLVTGLGDYEYSLDNENWQTSNIFSNIEAGIYTVYVKDVNGCGIEKKEISVLGIPKYFTPNGDGFNDYWNVKGMNRRLNAETIIYIFDRYGKLITQIKPLTPGWDGTCNGNPVPSSDYWYTIELQDGRMLKGHFSLKR